MAGVIGVCKLSLSLPESQSLKDKRQVLQSLQSRLRNTYSVSTAEVSHQDKWQVAEILVAYCSSNSRNADEVMTKVISWVENCSLPLILLDGETEIIHSF